MPPWLLSELHWLLDTPPTEKRPFHHQTMIKLEEIDDNLIQWYRN